MADKLGLEGYTGKEIRNPVKAIRQNCLDCVCGSAQEVKLCPCTNCPLYPFRFGSNPYRTERVLTDEQKAEQAERLKAARLSAVKNKADRQGV